MKLTRRVRGIHPRVIGTLVFFAAFLVLARLYWPVLGAPFVFDTHLGFHDYSTSTHFGGNRWLLYVTLGWFQKWFGNDPFWARLPNVILHGLNALLLAGISFTLIHCKNSHSSQGRKTAFLCFFGALLFLFHPVTVYGVAYAIQRSILLATFFALLAMLFWLQGLKSSRAGWFYPPVIFYMLALSSKEHVIMLPAVLVLLLGVYSGRNLRHVLAKCVLPLVLLGIIGLYKVFEYRGILGTVYEPYAGIVLVDVGNADLDLAVFQPDYQFRSILMQGYLFFRYGLTWVLPLNSWLSIDVTLPFPESFYAQPEIFGLILYLLMPLVLGGLAWKNRQARPVCLMLLVPWVMFWTEFTAVRFHEIFVLYRSYLWMGTGFAVVPLIFRRWPLSITAPIFLVCLVFFGRELENRVMTFASPLSVWEDAARKIDRGILPSRLPQANRILSNYGKYLAEAGRYEESFRAYHEAIRYFPGYFKAHCGAGSALAFLKRYPEAVESLNKCRDLNPAYDQVYYNLGNVYMKINDVARAEENFKKAIAVSGFKMDGAYFNLGNLYFRQGHLDRAEEMYLNCLKLNPKDYEAARQLNAVKAGQGSFKNKHPD